MMDELVKRLKLPCFLGPLFVVIFQRGLGWGGGLLQENELTGGGGG